MTAVPTLEVSGLSHAFGPEQVLEDINLRLRAREIIALVGPSGCGKTTVLHLTAGLLKVQHGQVHNPFATTAFMFQQPRLLPWKTALDNITLGLKAAGMARAEREFRARDLGLRIGFTHRDFDKFPHQLSGGMQSRVALARALVMQPDLLLLDEPFSALDVGLKEELYRLLLAHHDENRMSVLMITHDLMEAVRLSDAIVVMAPAPGRIVCRFELARAPAQRDDGWVYQHTAALLQTPALRASFGLPPTLGVDAPDNVATRAPAGLRVVAAAATSRAALGARGCGG